MFVSGASFLPSFLPSWDVNSVGTFRGSGSFRGKFRKVGGLRVTGLFRNQIGTTTPKKTTATKNNNNNNNNKQPATSNQEHQQQATSNQEHQRHGWNIQIASNLPTFVQVIPQLLSGEVACPVTVWGNFTEWRFCGRIWVDVYWTCGYFCWLCCFSMIYIYMIGCFLTG